MNQIHSWQLQSHFNIYSFLLQRWITGQHTTAPYILWCIQCTHVTKHTGVFFALSFHKRAKSFVINFPKVSNNFSESASLSSDASHYDTVYHTCGVWYTGQDWVEQRSLALHVCSLPAHTFTQVFSATTTFLQKFSNQFNILGGWARGGHQGGEFWLMRVTFSSTCHLQLMLLNHHPPLVERWGRNKKWHLPSSPFFFSPSPPCRPCWPCWKTQNHWETKQCNPIQTAAAAARNAL